MLFLIQIFLLFTIRSSGQQVTWGLNIGSTGIDYSQGSFLDPAGNILTCGEFRGVNVDFDPSPATAFHSSNGITPNNDGLNDCFKASRWGAIQKLEFRIYNRWGEMIFFTTDPNKCWDGTYKGVKQDPGVFVYWIRANTSCDPEVFRKGTVVLIR